LTEISGKSGSRFCRTWFIRNRTIAPRHRGLNQKGSHMRSIRAVRGARHSVRAMAVVTALTLGVGGIAAPGTVATAATNTTSPGGTTDDGERRLAKLRARLSPELVRLLDEVGRHIPLASLAADGTLDGLERATGSPEPEPFDIAAEDTPRNGGPGGSGAKGSSGLTFDMNLFERNIRAALARRTVGYAYSIGKAGQLDRQAGVGFARVAPDNPVTSQSATKVMTVASISKPVTAAGALRLLEQKDISVDSPIGPWLPAAWERGDGVDDITFRDLMTHRSGLLQNYQAATGTDEGESTGSWGNIRIAVGQELGSKSYKYANMNFSIFRILVPKIAYGVDLSALYDAPPANVTPAQIDYLTGVVYLGYLKPVLALAGAPVSCNNSDPKPTKLYAYPTNGQAGWGPADYVASCGGFGYNMSANGIASFISHVRYTDTVVSAAARSLMVEEKLGLQTYNGEHGTYHGHGAVWAMSGGRGMRGCVMSFHIKIDVALLVNSRGDYPSGCAVVLESFDNAWH
jgi:CubicO group peptidase (beta-lactamase class C family)